MNNIERPESSKRELLLASLENREIFEEILPAMESLARQLESNFRSEKYDVVVGEDDSGRIPTLILWKLYELISKKGSRCIFANGLSGGKKKPSKIPLSTNTSVLYITEYVMEGYTTNRTITKTEGIKKSNVDLAIVWNNINDFENTAKPRHQTPFGRELQKNTNLIFVGANKKTYAPGLYERKDLSGIRTHFSGTKDLIYLEHENIQRAFSKKYPKDTRTTKPILMTGDRLKTVKQEQRQKGLDIIRSSHGDALKIADYLYQMLNPTP